MEPIRSGKLGEHIESAVVTFSDTEETLTLQTKGLRANHFFPKFMVGTDEIQLRLDWGILNHNGHPMLDADFIDPKTDKHRRINGERSTAHHTPSSSNKARLYKWEFGRFSRKFVVTATWRSRNFGGMRRNRLM